MRLRPFIMDRDYEEISNWITEERAHALWCANRMPYPMDRQGLESLLQEIGFRFGDSAYVATTDDGKVTGFFCYGVNLTTNEGMLKFVMVDPAERGKGIGKAMLRLAVRYAFAVTGADAVQLNVFPENPRAQKCYEGVGFRTRKTDLNAFRYKDESWGRRNMVIRKTDGPAV